MATLMHGACFMVTLAVTQCAAHVEYAVAVTEDDECSALQVRKTAALSVQPPPGAATVDPVALGFVENPEALEIRAAEAVNTEEWEPCTAPYRACADGHRMPPNCAYPFTYSGAQHHTCLPSSTGRHWCSIDDPYRNWWLSGQRCTLCTQQSALPEDKRWLQIARSFACTDMVITGGSASLGRRAFTFINGYEASTTEDNFPAFSGGKWLGSVAIAGAVNDGHLSFDTRAADVFEWWTKDAADPKSRVTLRDLLQFSSGFHTSSIDMGHTAIPCMRLSSFPFQTSMEDCAKEVYDYALFNESRIGKWVDVLNYNSMHQVVALAMATKTTGLQPSEYLKKYLYEPAGMTHTTVYPTVRPILSAFMHTTVDDYDRFFSKYTAYEILPKTIVDELEADSGNGAEDWINAMGMSTMGSIKVWGGSIIASVDRSTQTYQILAPPVSEYPRGARDKWSVVHPLIHDYLDQVHSR